MGSRESSDREQGSGRLKRFASFLALLLVLVIVVAVAGVFAARTDGGRAYIEGYVSDRAGMILHAARSRVEWPYALVLEDVRSKACIATNEPVFRASELRIAPGFRTLLRVSVRGGVLNLVRSDDGGWMPSGLNTLGELPMRNLAEISRITASLRREMAIEAGGCSVRWLDSWHRPLSAAWGISFRVSPLQLPDRVMYLYKLSVEGVIAPGGERVGGTEREWLASEKRDYIEIARGGWGTAAAKGFWEVGE